MKTIALGIQDFARIRQSDYFYIDKTAFIQDWWQSGSLVTLLTRPRRFGKSLMIDTVERFFTLAERDQEALFGNLAVWSYPEIRKLAGKFPVIRLSFSGVKAQTFAEARDLMVLALQELFRKFPFLTTSPKLDAEQHAYFSSFGLSSNPALVQYSLRFLSTALHRVFGVKPIILLDEYDTPMQEAWLHGYWNELIPFIRTFMNLSFKDNPDFERALLTGITRVSKESIFSDLNNPDVITALSSEYQTAFGFTESEVIAAMKDYGLNNFETVKSWYDGFVFGDAHGIYNPWSVTNFLKKKRLAPYWANTSSNELAGRLVQTGSSDIKQAFERLLNGEAVTVPLCEEIVFQDMQTSPAALWSLLLASGYLKVIRQVDDDRYELALTNLEVQKTFDALITRWFSSAQDTNYPDFIEALLSCDVENMNFFLNQLTRSVFSFFDATGAEPERFYHGFVLGLLVTLRDRYVVTSNRESGLGRYDVMLEPLDKTKDLAFILEFKAKRPGTSGTLQDVVEAAHRQITDKHYADALVSRGMDAHRIRSYGFAFEGKRVLVG